MQIIMQSLPIAVTVSIATLWFINITIIKGCDRNWYWTGNLHNTNTILIVILANDSQPEYYRTDITIMIGRLERNNKNTNTQKIQEFDSLPSLNVEFHLSH